jgi:hypothetical protein
VDQESPTSSLFFYEQFDTTLTRETVADLLLGVYDQNLYDSKQRKIDAERELEDIRREVKVIKQFVPNELNLYPEHVKTSIENKERELNSVEEELIQLKEKNKVVRYTKNTLLEFEKLNEEATLQRNVVNNLDSEIKALKYEIEDSKYFIETLNSNLKQLGIQF